MGPGERDHWEVVVVGGGPAGSAAATSLARRGRSVLLLERERFPRFHIGESLLPASNPILRDLGVEGRIQEAGFVVKRGASFWTEDGERESYIDFSLARDVAEPRTYQVPRERFDHILLEHARECGAEALEGCRAEGFESVGDCVRITYRDGAGVERQATGEVLIDASGQAGFLARRLRLRRPDPLLRSVAIHSQYERVRQLDGERAGDIRIISLRRMGWIWLIPLSSTVTSVGVVAPREDLARLDAQAGGALEGTLTAVPSLARLFTHANRIAPLRRDADFSYSPARYAGNRWLLAGDAASFLDPVFSTGVLMALMAGREAAETAHLALQRGDLSARSFAAYERRQARTHRYFRRMVAAFYDPAFRDVMFRPSNRLGMLEAVVSMLAGNPRPGPLTRCRLALLFAIVALHRRVGISERIHSRSAAEGAA
jgi:flavin-dependent dehydrogenase